MGKWIEQQNQQKETKEKDKTRREKLAGFFFDLAKLCFAGLVVGAITPLLTQTENGINWAIIIGGIISTYWFAFSANNILKG